MRCLTHRSHSGRNDLLYLHSHPRAHPTQQRIHENDFSLQLEEFTYRTRLHFHRLCRHCFLRTYRQQLHSNQPDLFGLLLALLLHL